MQVMCLSPSSYNVWQIRWLQKLSEEPGVEEVPPFSKEANDLLENTISSFSVAEAQKVKDIERVTNHDVKAMEYYLKETLGGHNDVSKVPKVLALQRRICLIV
jgi:adenylosuccinate lyase